MENEPKSVPERSRNFTPRPLISEFTSKPKTPARPLTPKPVAKPVAKTRPVAPQRKYQQDIAKPKRKPAALKNPNPQPASPARPLASVPQQVSQTPVRRSYKKSRRLKTPEITGLLAAVLILAITGVYYWQHNRANNLQTQLSEANNKIQSVTTKATTPNQMYLYLYKYGLKLPLSSSIEDLYYTSYVTDSSGDSTLSFSTQSLTDKDLACTAEPSANNQFLYEPAPTAGATPVQTAINGSPFGLVTITKTAIPQAQIGSTSQDAGLFIASLNSYFIYYKAPQSSCSTNASLQGLIKTQQGKFLYALKNIEVI